MQEERRPLDPTRRLLRTFGVKVTDYEEQTARLLERAAALPPGETEQRLALVLEALSETAELNARLREMANHVLETQARVLAELKQAVERR